MAIPFDALIDLGDVAAGSGGFKIQGEAARLFAGYSVSAAGDVDGDGFADLIVGADNRTFEGTGAAYVVFGTTSGFATPVDLDAVALGSGGFKIQGEASGDVAGRSVAAAGDVNGDGIDDLIVGAPNNENGGPRAGAAYVVFGETSGFATPVDFDVIAAGSGGLKIQGVADFDFTGISVSAAGDVNGDGFADLIVGALGSDDAGAAYVVFGAAAPFATPIDLAVVAGGTGGFKIQGEAAYDNAGYSVSSAGDVNGDGFADLLVGAKDNDGGGNLAGAAYVVFGKASGFAATIDLGNLGDDGFKIQGENAGDVTGQSVAAAGDVDGDGLDDLIVGATRNDADPITSTSSNEGAAYVLFGRAFTDGPTPQNDVLMDPDDETDTTIDLLEGDGSYTGRDGDDVITGNAGRDWLRGGSGNDIFQTGGFVPDLLAPNGTVVLNRDMVSSNGAFDQRTVSGRELTLDVLDGGEGFDVVQGTGRNDVVVLSAPSFAVFTGQERTERLISIERFDFDAGNDVLGLTTGSSQKYTTDVTAFGGRGLDALWGGSGDDLLNGGTDADNLVGGFGDDDLTGGTGNDVFGFAEGFGNDVITDFTQGQDKIRLKGFGLAAVDGIAVGPSDTVLTLTDATTVTITLLGFTGTLTAGDFQIVA